MRFVIWMVILLVMPAITACRKPSEKPTVTVSIPPQAWMLSRIVGNDLEINTLLPPGADAETFEPSMQAQRALEESREYAMAGTLPFETALEPKLRGMYPKLTISKAFHCDTHCRAHEHGNEHEHEHEHEHGVDPHVWTTPMNLQVMADSLLLTAIRINPAGSARYRRNHAELSRRLTQLQEDLERNLEPLRGRDVVIWHPSLSYMAMEFGFRQIAVQEGHKEPSPHRMGEVIDRVSRCGTVAFVIEKEHSPRMAETLNADMRLPLVHTSLMQPDIIDALLNLSRELNAAARKGELRNESDKHG